jgi:hypothetical protein
LLSGKRNLLYSPFSIAKRDKIAILATYPKEDKFLNIIDVAKVLVKHDFSVVIIDNSEHRVDFSDKNLHMYHFKRKNLGFDLASYRDAVSILPEQPSELLFMNDSMIWDTIRLDEFIDRVRSNKNGIYFPIKSSQPYDHFQTYFIYIKGTENLSRLFNWFHTLRNWRDKNAAVLFGELKTWNFFSRSANAIFSEKDCVELFDSRNINSCDYENSLRIAKMRASEIDIRLNPSHYYWKEMVMLGFPGIKRDLIEQNKSNIPICIEGITSIFFEPIHPVFDSTKDVFIPSRKIQRIRRFLKI